MLKAYADEHVTNAIVQSLRKRGMDVVTVQERGRRGIADAELLKQALQDERILLTNDHDFLSLAAKTASRGEMFAPVFFWPQQKRRVGSLVQRIIKEASQLAFNEACSKVFFF